MEASPPQRSPGMNRTLTDSQKNRTQDTFAMTLSADSDDYVQAAVAQPSESNSDDELNERADMSFYLTRDNPGE